MEPTEDCPFVEGLVFQIWYPFDIREHMWVGTTFDVNLLSGAITFFVYSKIMPTVLTLFLLARIRILKVKIRRFDVDCEEVMAKQGIARDEAMAFVIKRFVEEHQEVYELMELVQSASKTIVLFLFFGNAMDLPSYLIEILLGDAVIFLRNFGALVLALVQVYVFFWFANESLAISDTIYNETNWITYSRANKMLLLMVLHRSHRNFALKAAAIGEMSLSTFTKVKNAWIVLIKLLDATYKDFGLISHTKDIKRKRTVIYIKNFARRELSNPKINHCNV
nr:unnamed protein product [Callosobruchus chinensis]